MALNYKYNYPQVARESGFKLRNYKDGPLDWRLVGSVEIERIVKDQCFEQLDGVLNHLSEVPLGSVLDSNILDSGISKYFILSQFSVQYLIFCRTFLEETVSDLRESHSISQVELATLKRSLSEANNEILQLHKKITQMEAIHEVIYPCHLCTKNFANNDALNLHICRKHNGSLSKSEKMAVTSVAPCKERENDLTLINTIKLELEIKQLKERLNNAEREIKDKNVESDTKVLPENVTNPLQKSVNSVGIQSNLSEIKERDDSKLDDMTTSRLNKQQLHLVQETLLEFEKWKEDQKLENSQFLAQISNKMEDIGTVLRMDKNQNVQEIENEKHKSSVEGLENLLTKKIEEIGKTTADNLEYIIKAIEINCQDKLHQLQKLINLNEQYILQKDVKFNENVTKSGNNYLQGAETRFNDESSKQPTEQCENNSEEIIHLKGDENVIKENSASESNHTFVKCSNYDNYVSTSDVSEGDCTDVSTSVLDDENVDRDYELIKNSSNTKKLIKEENRRAPPQTHTKIMTNKSAKKLANKRLSSLGVDIKSKTLTPLLKKKFLDDLNEGRSKIKQKHPDFYATRNKMKKFLDKLCSTKMPPNAKALLRVTKQVKPKVQKHLREGKYSLSDKKGAECTEVSTPANETAQTDGENFKQRLERILASPIRNPNDHIIKAIIHGGEKNKNPVPMPRKRVMFNHPEVQEVRSTLFSSQPESDKQ